MIDDIAYVLRALAQTCLDSGAAIELTRATIRAWLAAAETRGCKPSGIALQIGLLQRFCVLTDAKPKLRVKLGDLAAHYRTRAQVMAKRKEDWLLRNPVGIGDIWETASALLAGSRGLSPGSRARHKAVREAACLALAVAAPLRIGGLSRIRFGEHLGRTASGWSLAITTSKTGQPYHRPDLWPELTPFLDALVEIDAPGGDLWSGHDARAGTPAFSTDFGRTGLAATWFSQVWRDHVGCGAHIVRTLWHQIAHDSDADQTWMALALCGQRGARTATHYVVRNARARAVRGGRGLLAAARAAALSPDRDPGKPAG